LACLVEGKEMALVLNEEQQMLRDSARDFLQDRAPVRHLRSLRDTNNTAGFSRELWSEMTDMGWPAILVPEQYGGLEYGYTGIGIVLEESGRTLTPSPLLCTSMMAAAAIVKAGSDEQREALLPGIAGGELLLALACDESPRHAPHKVDTRADEDGTSYRISGSKLAVADGHVADTFIVSARTGKDISLFLVPADTAGVRVEPYKVLDTHFSAHVNFDRVEVGKKNLFGSLNGGLVMLDYILDVGRAGVAAELLGIAQEAFERTIQYLQERKQFGVPIGSFQALQHRAAHLYTEIEMCKSLVIKSLQALDEKADGDAELISLTKSKLGETAHLATTEAIQMHGGIGMTDEFDIGFFLKRCRILENLYGDNYYHLDRFARLRGY
jgi:alkylation response protein AidB-like acyl-CoA dehydrogenase